MKENFLKYMNEKHSDIITALYKKYGNAQTSVGVKLSDVDENGIFIEYQDNVIQIPFEKKITDPLEYEDAIIKLCSNTKNTKDFSKIEESLIKFIDSKKTVIISSYNDGTCVSSYAPFVREDNKIFITISKIAPHFKSLSIDKNVSLMFIQDEKDAFSIFARLRATFCVTPKFHYEQDIKDKIFDKFVDLYPDDASISFIRNMSDFCVVEFELLSKGRYVKGFGAAYDLEGLKVIKQAGSTNPHSYKR